ncbi:MAG: chromosome segregation protein SMC, partial [Megasphaera micronuciformis]
RLLDEERRAYEGTLTLQELKNFERLLSKAENIRQQAFFADRNVEKQIEAKERERQRIMASIEAEGARMQALNEAAGAAKSEADRLRERLERYDLQVEDNRRIIETVKSDLQDISIRKKKVSARISELISRLESGRAEEKAAVQSVTLTEKLMLEATTQAEAIQESLRSEEKAVQLRKEKQYALHRDVEDFKRRLAENIERSGELKERIERVEERKKELERHHLDLEAEIGQVRINEKSLQDKLRTASEELESLKKSLDETAKQEGVLKSECDALRQKLHLLEGLERDGEGLGRAVKTVLQSKEPWSSSVCGIAGNLCRIPEEYMTAIDTALGGASRHIVVTSEKAAKEAVTFLKRIKAGRATFLPVDTVRSRHLGKDEEAALAEEGIIGTAKSLVSYDAVYESVFSSLLEKTLIAESVDRASEVARKYRNCIRIVCLDGTVFNVGGSLTGGSSARAMSSVTGRKQVIEKTACDLRKKEDVLQNISAEVATATRIFNERSTAATLLTRKFNETTEVLRRCEWQLQKSAADYEQIKDEIRNEAAGEQRLNEVRSEIQNLLVKAQERLSAYEEKENTSIIEDLKQQVLKARENTDYIGTSLTERRIEAAKLTELIAHLQESRQEQIGRLEELGAQEKGLSRKLDEVKEQIESLSRQRRVDETLLVEKEKAVIAKEADKNAFYQARETNFSKGQAADEELKLLREEKEHYRQQISRADIQIEKYGSESSRCTEKLTDQGLTREEAEARKQEGSLRELQETVRSLKSRIAELGTVNPNADEEYREVAAKAELYEQQSRDLAESQGKLEAIVAEIDKAMSMQFEQAFNEIGGYFQQIFSRLFGGGTAKILLNDTHNILTSGIDFLIQPPGKKAQSLTLLSGGERALTVIALLLAFLAYRPAPFCLVDEVDAALDEANVDRMARYLKNYSGDTQFIVITHRRKSMEAANTLQGVTMEEKGVSKLITVQVDEFIEKGT